MKQLLSLFIMLQALIVLAACQNSVNNGYQTSNTSIVTSVSPTQIINSSTPTISPSVSATPSSKPTSTSAIKIGLVDNSQRQYQDGCGCSFWNEKEEPIFDDPKTHKYILLGNYEKQAWMNIEDKIVELRLVKDTTKYQGKKGDRYFQTYRANNIMVKVDCVADGFGDTHAVFCDATITVTKGTRRQTVKAIGSCGC